MTFQSEEKQREISYGVKTLTRATRALICSPFRLHLFVTMVKISIPLPEMALNQGIAKNYTKQPIGEGKVEQELMWLIKVGLLRREVDGQGITDSFRLTPLGRQIIAKWRVNSELPSPSWQDRLINRLSRWLNFTL